MRKHYVIAWLIIIIGIGFVFYPIYLRALSRADQKELIRNFYEKGDATIVDNEDINKAIPKEYGKWPDTLMEIPKLSLKVAIVEVEDLSVFQKDPKHPPGHYPNTAIPGEIGNVGIAGHRTGPSDYFRHIDRLTKGDDIILHTHINSYYYRVEDVFITEKTNWDVLKQTDYASLTLTSCQSDGKTSNAKRIIVKARLAKEE